MDVSRYNFIHCLFFINSCEQLLQGCKVAVSQPMGACHERYGCTATINSVARSHKVKTARANPSLATHLPLRLFRRQAGGGRPKLLRRLHPGAAPDDQPPSTAVQRAGNRSPPPENSPHGINSYGIIRQLNDDTTRCTCASMTYSRWTTSG